MKRVNMMIASAVTSLAIASTASANVFFENPDSEFDIKFKGIEYVFDLEGNQVTNVNDLISGIGYTMNGMFYVDTINLADGKGNALPYPAVYHSNSPDAYFGYLQGLTIAEAIQTGSNTWELYFSGGTLDWFYSTEISREDMIGVRWDAVDGRYEYTDGTAVDLSGESHFMQYALNYDIDESILGRTDITGKAIVTLNQDGTLTANFSTWGDLQPIAGSPDWMYNYFDTDRYGMGHDIELNATLRWGNGGDNYFRVNDPALLSSTATPEPGTFILMSLGLLLTAFVVRRQQKGTM